jgi:sorbitol-specific phosphotransferase system component IIC
MLPVAWVAFWSSLFSYIELCQEFFRWLGLFVGLTLLATHIGHCQLPPVLSWSVSVLHFGQ